MLCITPPVMAGKITFIFVMVKTVFVLIPCPYNAVDDYVMRSFHSIMCMFNLITLMVF